MAIWVGRAPGGDAVYVNGEFERILGITPPDDAARGNYVGPYGVHLPSGEKYPEGDMPFERVLRSQRREVIDDVVIHRHDGTRCFLRVLASPLFDDAGALAFVVEAFTDITNEVEAEQRRVDGERQLQAVQRLESVGSLAGGVAHDFNNLLAVVKLIAGQLRLGEADADRLELLASLDEVSDKAAHLTRALLGFARRGKHLAQPLAIGAVVDSVVGLARRTFERRLTVKVDAAASPDVVVGDAAQIEQIVMNLVMNARDAIVGEGCITVRTRRLRVEQPTALLAPGDHIAIEVEDTGGGIDPAVRDRIFEPYVSTKAASSLKGTGLGLATVYGCARAHGGAADIASTSTSGTTMRVTLPASSAPLPAGVPRSVAGKPLAGKGTILVVDDEPLVLRMTARTVASLGYDVVTANDGRSAIAAVQEDPARFHGVVLDMIMAGLSGRETYLALRALQPNIRVVLTTGYALNHEAQQILDLGVQGFVSKPFDPLELSQALERLMR
ncbi:MAG: response regulator [Deltaproteobacteria bacterium]|nr:response regulator [Deltaproteobacteria bacterium]